MKPENLNIIDLIPQRPPMVMIDQLTYARDNIARGSLYIKESNIFCEAGHFQEAGLIEFLTQTAAAYKGYQRLLECKEIKEGYIGLIKNLFIHFLPPVDTEIHSKIIIEDELLDYLIISGRTYQNNVVIAEGEMRILSTE